MIQTSGLTHFLVSKDPASSGIALALVFAPVGVKGFLVHSAEDQLANPAPGL